MIYGLPNDWYYQVKKALNREIYSNPAYFSDMIDIVKNQVEHKIGTDNITKFDVDDVNRTINFRFTYPDILSAFRLIDEIHVICIIGFCMAHKNEIICAINKQAGKVYSDAFVDMLENNHNVLISQLSIFFGHPALDKNQFCVTFRLY